MKAEEIGRLIEERRSTFRGEKQRLKDFKQTKRKNIRDKKIKRQEMIQRILEDFKGIENTHHQDKE